MLINTANLPFSYWAPSFAFDLLAQLWSSITNAHNEEPSKWPIIFRNHTHMTEQFLFLSLVHRLYCWIKKHLPVLPSRLQIQVFFSSFLAVFNVHHQNLFSFSVRLRVPHKFRNIFKAPHLQQFPIQCAIFLCETCLRRYIVFLKEGVTILINLRDKMRSQRWRKIFFSSACDAIYPQIPNVHFLRVPMVKRKIL